MSCNNQLLGIALVLIGIGGCSKPSADLAKASGLVTLDGVPVPEAKIMFHPVAGGARTSYGTTNEKGEFKASTFGMYDGALVGHHQVTITKVDTSTQAKVDPKQGYMGGGYDQMMAPKAMAKNIKPAFVIPAKYSVKETSGIEVDVVKGESNNFPFDLKTK